MYIKLEKEVKKSAHWNDEIFNLHVYKYAVYTVLERRLIHVWYFVLYIF